MKLTLLVVLYMSLVLTAVAQTGAAIKTDEFGVANCEDELARLDVFASNLLSNQFLQGYIIAYSGKATRRNQTKADLNRMRVYLVIERKLPANRLILIDGGFRSEGKGTELWTGEKGQPAPSPSPTMDKKDVIFKGRARIRNRSCSYGLG